MLLQCHQVCNNRYWTCWNPMAVNVVLNRSGSGYQACLSSLVTIWRPHCDVFNDSLGTIRLNELMGKELLSHWHFREGWVLGSNQYKLQASFVPWKPSMPTIQEGPWEEWLRIGRYTRGVFGSIDHYGSSICIYYHLGGLSKVPFFETLPYLLQFSSNRLHMRNIHSLVCLATYSKSINRNSKICFLEVSNKRLTPPITN